MDDRNGQGETTYPRMNRRTALQCGSVLSFGTARLPLGALGLTVGRIAPRIAHGSAAHLPTAGFGQARSCILMFAWGGMSHLDTWDPKPTASSEIRGEFAATATAVSGIHLCQYLPRLARHARHLAIVRGVHHSHTDHLGAGYYTLTGHVPPHCPGMLVDGHQCWPFIGSTVSRWTNDRRAIGASRTVTLPFAAAAGQRLSAQYAGFLGQEHDPIFVRPNSIVHPLSLPADRATCLPGSAPNKFSRRHWNRRLRLLQSLESAGPLSKAFDRAAPTGATSESVRDNRYHLDLQRALDVNTEPEPIRREYGNHLMGQSALVARRLVEAGAPLVTVHCGAADLGRTEAAHWDTHVNNFNRLSKQMLPPFDQTSAALLEDLHRRGMLEETLVVWLTEFGRTPKINSSAGRDHHTNCYSVALAGGGIAGGQTFGRTDRAGYEVADRPCTPADLHATIYHALGIDPGLIVTGPDGKPGQLVRGSVMPLFG